MIVNIYKLGEEQVVTGFPLGLHILGRGPALQCNDKRVSRNHATLEVTQDCVKLKSTHINPCFLRAANSKTITILAKDSSTELNNGDAFAFLPDDFWFKIKVEESNTDDVETKKEMKRPSLSFEDEGPPDKRARTENLEESNRDVEEPPNEINSELKENECFVGNNEPVPETSATANAEKLEVNIGNNEAVPDAEELEKDNGDTTTIKQEVEENIGQVIADDRTETDEVIPKQELKTEQDEPSNNSDITDAVNQSGQSNESEPDNKEKDASSDTGGDGNAGPSKHKPRRERCWYGAQCYRKNPVHRQDYTHPGDSDFESDPEDNRPTCSYGASCYRKNLDHRRDYKHPPRQPPSKKKRNRKKVDRLNVADSEEMRGLSDSEDPFLADDDSDEYTGNSDEEDSDWEASQDVEDDDEDSENVKRLIKEANRFVKK